MAMEGRTDELREEALWALDQETVVRSLYEVFAAWDMEPVAGLLSVDVVFHVPGTRATRATIAAAYSSPTSTSCNRKRSAPSVRCAACPRNASTPRSRGGHLPGDAP
jgi:hypothetical protein